MAFNYLAKLVAKLELQSAQYQAELEKANKRLERFERDSKKSFSSIDKSAKKLAEGLKGVGAVLGAGGAVALGIKGFGTLSRGADAAIANLAKTNVDFAATLDRTKAAHENLWKAGTRTAEAQERLNAALKDPAIVGAAQRAADGLASSYISIKTGALEALSAVQKFDRWFNETSGLYSKSSGLKQDYDALVSSKMPEATAAQQQKDAAAGPNPYMKLVNDAFAREAKEAADAAQRAMDAAAKDADAFARTFASQMADAYSAIGDGAQEEMARIKTYFIDPHVESFDRAVDSAQKSMDKMSTYADQAARNMQDAFADFLFDPFDKGVKGMAKDFLDTTRRLLANKATEKLFNWIGVNWGGTGGILGAIGDLFGGARAEGGPVTAGKAYLVGERGPELFSPGASGHITPNHALGGIVQNITVDARGATIDAIRAIPAAMAETKRQAVAEVADLIRRGRL